MSDPKLSAWLDGELAEAEVSWTPELRTEAESLRRADAALLDWYREPLPKPARRRRPLMIAAAVVLAVLLSPLLLRQGAESLAEEALERTWSRLREAQGILVEYRIRSEREGTLAGHATGQVRIHPLGEAGMPDTFCREHREGEEAPSDLEWKRTADGLFRRTETLRGRVGDRGVVWGDLILGETSSGASPQVDFWNGSPVDFREGRAASQMVVLLREFRRESFRKWAGQAWTQERGKGTAEDPWIYRAEPFGPGTGDRLVWILGISVDADGIVHDLILEERILGQDGVARTTMKTECVLTIRQRAWTEGEMNGDDTSFKEAL